MAKIFSVVVCAEAFLSNGWQMLMLKQFACFNLTGLLIPAVSMPVEPPSPPQTTGQPIYLAGIYDTINGVNCFIILTTEPNDSVAPIHDRMPLLLSHEQVRPWLVDAGAALELLCSRPPLLLRTSCDGQLGFDDLA